MRWICEVSVAHLGGLVGEDYCLGRLDTRDNCGLNQSWC